jgi:dCTP deaminase
MMLSGFDIEHLIETGRLRVSPFVKRSVRENGMDFRLADEIAHHNTFKEGFVLDPAKNEHIDKSYNVMKNESKLIISAHEQVLLSTLEYIGVPDDIAGFVELRSTWARHGLSMPPTIIDAGFKGTVTLEVVNNAPYAIKLRAKQRFAHIILEKLNNRTGKKYNGNYNMQNGIKLPQVLK